MQQVSPFKRKRLGMAACAACRLPDPLYACGGKGCAGVLYCGASCQQAHWVAKHQFDARHQSSTVLIEGKRDRDEEKIQEGNELVPVEWDQTKHVLMQTADYRFFLLTLKEAKKSRTIANIIEDAGTNSPVPLPNIRADILKYIVHYMKTNSMTIFESLSYPILIGCILAANYLDVQGPEGEKRSLVSFLTFGFRQDPLADRTEEGRAYGVDQLRYGSAYSVIRHFETYANGAFNKEEQEAITQEGATKALLDKIRNPERRLAPTSPQDLRLIDVSKDVLDQFILPGVPDYLGSTGDVWRALLEFRKLHVYFWHVTTRHMANMSLRISRELANYSLELRFEFMHRLVGMDHPYGADVAKKDFAVTWKEIEATRPKMLVADWPRALYLLAALEHYESFDKMEREAARRAGYVRNFKANKQRKEDEAKRATREREENRKVNAENIHSYLESQGYKVYATPTALRPNIIMPVIEDRRITDFAHDPAVQDIIDQVEARIASMLDQPLLNTSDLLALVTFAKFKEVVQQSGPLQKRAENNLQLRLIATMRSIGYILTVADFRRLKINGPISTQEIGRRVKEEFTLQKYGLDLVRFTTPGQFQKLLSEYVVSQKQQVWIDFKTRLEEQGYLYSVEELIVLGNFQLQSMDFDAVLTYIQKTLMNSGDLGQLSKHMTTAKFLEVIKTLPNDWLKK